MTDNRVGDSIVTPAETVCYDEPDPYLVVAADKGTATFSDIANGIAVERGFWLGDAFASGGSNGYDHKKLGITAKGAWEAVKRHFYELGHDLETTPITITGVGDMSGDVFGNGLLLSHQAKLIAAFDHRHIFIDPTPDIATSFTERQRMFALPRSSWEDYDKGLISEGGGVWPRSARTIPLSPQVRTALGTDVLSATPEQLLHLILLAPVDLFYNGGIGTYIKASTETHAAVKDRANDNIRADGNQLRCKVVSEGGNLGATQAGRIEFALCGGRIFTDAIDNSAGVDCSDHEVNVKIWLDTEVNAGTLDAAGRNHILNSFTADIESLVLRDNTLQTHLLAREDQAQSEPDSRHGYAALIARLEAGDVISRKLEQLPDVAELARREAAGFGLTAPELAVVIAHVKNRYKRLLAALPLVSHDWARYLLTPYFPPALVATRDPLDHPLANAILATILANESVNRCGPLMLCDLAERHAVDETDVIIAWARGWAALNLAPTFEVLDANALIIAPEVSKALDRRTRGLQRAVSSGVLSMPVLAPFDTKVVSTEGKLDELTRLFGTPAAAQTWLGDTGKKASGKAETAEPTAFAIASKTVDSIEAIADFLFAALAVQRPVGVTLPAFLQLGIDVRRHSGIDRLERTLMLAAAAPSQQGLRGHALQALRRAQQGLVEQVLQQVSGKAGDDEAVMQCIDSVLHQVPQLPPEGEDDTVDQISLDEAILSAWNLSEAVSGLKLAV
jgi:glutamate dehydrogenase